MSDDTFKAAALEAKIERKREQECRLRELAEQSSTPSNQRHFRQLAVQIGVVRAEAEEMLAEVLAEQQSGSV